MKDFEKFLTELPKPAVDVPVFRDELRRELAGLTPSTTHPRWRFAAVLGGALAATLALVLVLFVVRPQIPASIHAGLSGGVETESSQALPLQLDDDRDFIDRWTAQQPEPASVRTMEGERLVRVRQFEMTDGKRVLVFTELDNENDLSESPQAAKIRRASSSTPVF